MKMKNRGHRNVCTYREINSSDKYITLESSLKSGSLDMMIITSSHKKDDL